ncbi:hypothetical protein CVT26_003760 [Gymnopilus dilepis]|uniref:F-box domain-containing protein n=1 Tax=Gymnopilus dilepis TaxID=231916 RepID=A0A409VRZ4_9AGAR|nr:hypothetical protein CVT26_003760 [Gymnopilus dilepis]
MGPSPIFKLDQDILWSIFSIIPDFDDSVENLLSEEWVPDMYSGDSFGTTISCSQVCRFWRNFLLQSPHIWRNNLRVEYYTGWKPEGRREILRRVGNGPLSIKGIVADNRNAHNIVVELLTMTWSRLKRLELGIRGHPWDTTDWRPVFCRPSPWLESFRLLGAPEAIYYLGLPPGVWSLFNGTAPLLREFQTTCINIDLRAGWISQLRTLQLSSRNITGSSVLKALRTMPMLEILDLCSIVGGPPAPYPTEKSICLPHLAYLRLSDNFDANLAIAHAVDPRDDCVLLWSDPRSAHTVEDEISLGVLIRYFKGFCSKRNIDSITCRTHLHYFRLHCSPKDIIQGPSHSSFRVDLCLMGDADKSTLNLVLRIFSAVNLTSVTKFHCDLDNIAFYSTENSSMLFEVFTYLPSSLAMLDISDHNLNRLLHFSTNISAFPFLRYLTIHFDNSRYTIDSELVLTFLLYRKAHGLSVPDLKLVGQIWAGDWDLLDCMVGLKVRWIENEKSNVESEYICGTGQPGLLAFSWRSEPRPSHTVPDLHVSQWRWYDEL